MSITVIKNLPAIDTLASENIFLNQPDKLSKTPANPLQILIINLMPAKETTEVQLLRALANSPLPT